MRDLFRLRLGVLGVAVTALAAACNGNGTLPTRTASNVPAPTSVSTSTLTVPNPFTIVARFTRASLGLKEPVARAYAPVSSTDLAIGPDGNLYLTDYQSQTVTVVSPSGKVVRRWGKPGRGAGQFSFAYDPTTNNYYAFIAVGRDGKVYVDDSGNHRVEIFSPIGTFVRQFGSYGYETNYQFVEPDELAVDSTRDLYVTDGGRGTVSKFSPTGRFVWRVGGSDASDPDLRGVGGLRNVDPHGRIVVTGPGEAIVYIDGQGRKVDVFRTLGDYPEPSVGTCDVTIDHAGDTFALSCPGPNGQDLSPPYRFELVFDRTHHLIGAWYNSPFATSPQFGPDGEVFALGGDGSILKLKVALPGA